MRQIFSITLGLLASVTSAVSAKSSDSGIALDQGLDVRKVIERVRERAATDTSFRDDFEKAVIAGLLSKIRRLPLPTEIFQRHVVAPPDFFGPWTPKIVNNPEFKNASQYPPRIRQLPPTSRDPLEAEWAELEDQRAGLLSTAGELEPLDRQLSIDADWIIAEDAALDKESSAIESDRTRYRNRCNVARPPSDCEAERRRLNARVERYNGRVRIFNARLEDWKRRRNDIEFRGKKLDAGIAAWGASLAQFAARAEKALEEGGESAIRVQAQGRDMATPGGKSVAFNVFGFVYLSQGKQVLGQLWEQLTDREREARQSALTQANRYMENAAAGGGTGPDRRSFRDDMNSDIRIDVDVLRGRAFVPDPALE